MKLEQVKVGAYIQIRDFDPVWNRQYRTAQVMAVHRPANPSDTEQVWIRFYEEKNGEKKTLAYDTRSLLNITAKWELVPQFFQIGKTYVFNGSTQGNKHTVLDVYEVENPASERERMVAVLRVEDTDGYQYITTGIPFDFERMHEV